MAEDAQDSSGHQGGGLHSNAGPPNRRPVRRKNFFVKKRLQSRYIVYYLAIMLFSGFALFALIQRAAHMALHTEMQQGHSTVLDTWSIFKPHIIRTNLIVVLTVVAVAAVTTLILTWTVHRAAESVVSNIRAYINGAPTEQWTAIRHPVEFQHLQDVMADALSNYQIRAVRIRQEAAGFVKTARVIREGAGEGGVPGEKIGELRDRLERVNRLFDDQGGGKLP